MGTKVSGMSDSGVLDGTEYVRGIRSGTDIKIATTRFNISAGRTTLIANQTLYVSASGSDTTGAGTVGNPWATGTKAYEYIRSNLNLNGFDVIISCADGTYTTTGPKFLLHTSNVSSDDWVGGGRIILRGNTTTPANVVINASDGDIISMDHSTHSKGSFLVEGFTLNGVDGLISCVIMGEQDVEIGNMAYGPSNNCINSQSGCRVTLSGTQSINNRPFTSFLYITSSTVNNEATVNAVSPVAFTAQANSAGVTCVQAGVLIDDANWTGTFTGTPYKIDGSSTVVELNGALIGGSTAGDVKLGGQYIRTGLYDSNPSRDQVVANQAYAVTFAQLPSSPVAGMMYHVTNSNTATWGATAAGGGSNKVLVWYNGTNWTVAGA